MPDRKPRQARAPSPSARGGADRKSTFGKPAPQPDEENRDTLAQVASYLEKGQPTLALPLLLPELDARASAGDKACALAAAALRLTPPDASPIPPDALSATVNRLVALVRRQDEQIRTLRTLIEDAL